MTNLEALEKLYISLGGVESDLENLTTSSEIIPLLKNVIGGGSGGMASAPVFRLTKYENQYDDDGQLISDKWFQPENKTKYMGMELKAKVWDADLEAAQPILASSPELFSLSYFLCALQISDGEYEFGNYFEGGSSAMPRYDSEHNIALLEVVSREDRSYYIYLTDSYEASAGITIPAGSVLMEGNS